MIKIEIFSVNLYGLSEPNRAEKWVGPVEEFIARVGYQNIKEIKMQSTNGHVCYYHIFYEDGQPYTPRPTSQKKGLFG